MKLYKYLKCNQFTYDALKNNYIWMSYPSTFNDPFDCQRLYDFYGENIDDKILVYCMSNSCINNLMWSHYADGHRGICVEYQFPDQFPFNYSKIDYPYFPVCKPVRYNSLLPAFNKYMPHLNKQIFLEHFIFTKDVCWEYENEWRFVIFLDHFPQLNHKFIIPNNSITGIYLGSKISDDDKQDVLMAIKHIDTELYQVYKSSNSYNLEVEHLNKPKSWRWVSLTDDERFLANQIDEIAREQWTDDWAENPATVDRIMSKLNAKNREFVLDRLNVNKRAMSAIENADKIIATCSHFLEKL